MLQVGIKVYLHSRSRNDDVNSLSFHMGSLITCFFAISIIISFVWLSTSCMCVQGVGGCFNDIDLDCLPALEKVQFHGDSN